MRIREFIGATLYPEKQYVLEKFEDHRAFTVAMFILAGATGLFLWSWDYVTDPVSAQHTILLRHGIPLFLLIFCAALSFGLSDRYIPCVALGSIWGCEILFTIILNRLNTGMVYGIGGYMYFILMPLLMLQGLTLRVNLIYDLGAALIPHFLSLLGIVQGFQHSQYAILIWPAVFMAAIAQYATEVEYFQRYHLKRILEASANTDPLTGVSNRRHFMERAGEEIKRAKRLSGSLVFLMMDIDFFKKINDKYGHPSGDKVIKALASTSKRQIREIDLLGRLGGEEFAVLLVDTDLKNGRLVAERIRTAIEQERVEDAGADIRFTVSIGVAVLQDDCDIDTVLLRADEGLYRAKKKGRNRVCYSTGSKESTP